MELRLESACKITLGNSVFRKLFSAKPEPLTGAPAVRRMKTYSAQTGYVYHYFFEGRRHVPAGDEKGTEYVFSASSDRKHFDMVAVRVCDAALTAWHSSHQRELSPTECYAVAKLALFQAFDERDPASMRQQIRVRNADLDSIVQQLEL